MSGDGSRRTRVYLANPDSHDVKDAERFGVLTPVIAGKTNVFDTGATMAAVAKALDGSHADDHLVLVGHTAIAVFVALAFFQKHDRVNILVWGPREQKYQPRTIRADEVDRLLDAVEALDESTTPVVERPAFGGAVTK